VASNRKGASTSRRLLTFGLTALGLSALLLTSAWLRIARRRPLSQNVLSLTGLISMACSLPLFLEAWKEWRAGRPMGLFPFLGLSTVFALGLGAASTAMNIVWTLSLGMFLEEVAMEKARRDVRKMVETAPDTAQVVNQNQAREKRVVDLEPGETVVVHPGWIIPVDGTVAQGQAMVDESKITGHQFPALRSPGDWVFGGTAIQEGSIQVNVERAGRETYLSKVLDLVEQALDSRSEVERKADMLASRMFKIGTASTLGTFLLTGNPATTVSVLLVMSCPCATILAASTALTASISAAASRNILIKSGAALETMSRIDCVCFDKTGTLTLQLPELVDVRPRTPSMSDERILELTSGAEASSQHPIARALVRAAQDRKIPPAEVSGLEVHLGRGVSGSFQGREVLVGNDQFLQDNGVDTSYFRKAAARHLRQGRSPVYLARDGKAQALLVLEARARPETQQVLEGLKHSGVAFICLISGDEQAVVQSMCTPLSFDQCMGDLRPEQKSEHIRWLQAGGYGVCMIGDGVNDALALSTADLGLAVGAGGSDAALEAADIVLMGHDLRDVLALRSLSRSTMRVIDQNFWIGAGSDYAGLGLAIVGLLTPFLGGVIHVGHTLAILANSARLLGWREHQGPSEGCSLPAGET
jgi:cation-transporting P-type ATPase C